MKKDKKGMKKMKKGNCIKSLFAVLISSVMLFSLISIVAFAEKQKVTDEIVLKGDKPVATAYYIDPNGKVNHAYDLKTTRECGLKVVETKYETITESGTEPYITNFWGNGKYLLIVTLSVKKAYTLPEDIKSLDVKINYQNTEPIELSEEDYRTPKDFKRDNGTYTLEYIEQKSKKQNAVLVLKYAFTVDAELVPEAVIKTKLPIADDFYLEPDGPNQEYRIDFIHNSGFYVEKQGWLIKEKDDTIHFDNKFDAGDICIMAMGLTFSPRYGMYVIPDDLKDVRFKIEFTNSDAVNLTEKEYREGKAFKFEPGTYTFREVEGEDYKYELLYVIEIPKNEKPNPAEKPTDELTSKPIKPDTITKPEVSRPAENETEVPNTGSSSSITVALLTISVVALGTAYIAKKK